MAVGDTLGVGISGLLAFQRALATTSHNISNVNTDGFSRQRIEFDTRIPTFAGRAFIGNGVQVSSIERMYNGFITGQLRTSTSSFHQLESYHQLAGQVDNLLADEQAGLSPALQDFFNAVQDVASNPASVPARQVMLSQAGTLVERFRSLNQRMDSLRDQINSEISGAVTEINNIASSIAGMNQEIVLLQNAGQLPNDLLDQRDLLIQKLSEKVTVSTLTQDDGAINVFIGNGQTLVVGSQAMALSTTVNPYATRVDSPRYEITVGGSTGIITGQITGGELGGMLQFRSEMLDPAQNALGRVATGLAMSFNDQHREGMDLTNALGGDFFSYSDAVVTARGTSAGTVSATITDANALTTSDYVVSYDGANWNVTRLSDNSVVASGAGPFSVDGLDITVGGTPATGDSFLVQPTAAGASGISVAIADAREIAAAAPIRTSRALANTGNAAVSAGSVLDVTDANLLNTVTIDFVNSSQYQINGAGPLIAYTSGADIDVNGWRVQISGTPQAGDTFTVESNTGGSADNRNALLLSAMQKQLTLANGTASYQDAYGQIVADVGSRTRATEINRDAQSIILDQAVAARESVSGVNLDEEAANIVRFQQAYQAAAQIIAVSDTLFQTLLGAVRR